MGLYRFLFVGLRFLHFVVGIFFALALIALAMMGEITSIDQLGHEVTTAVLAYTCFLFGIAVAIVSKLHRYVKLSPEMELLNEQADRNEAHED